MDEAYIRKRVSQIYAQSWSGGMINKFTALIIELLNEQAAQQSVQADGAEVAANGLVYKVEWVDADTIRLTPRR